MRQFESNSTHDGSARVMPLSLGQRRLWTIHQLRPHDPAYQQLSAVRLSGPLDLAALKVALQRVVDTHDSLRLRFPMIDGEVRACIEPRVPLVLHCFDLSGLSGPTRQAAVIRHARQDARRTLDLEGGPLLRASLLKLEERESVLLLCIHHMVIDGWSLGLLISEVAGHYGAHDAGPGSQTQGHKPTYGIDAYVRERLEAAQSDEYARSLTYWARHLDGLCWTRLASDETSAGTGTGRGLTQRFRLEDLHAPLDKLARSLCVTRYQLLLSAFALWMAHCSGNPDVTIVTLLANRPERKHQNLVGFLANTVVFRHRCDAGASLLEFVSAVVSTTQDLQRHGDVSLYSLAQHMPELLSSKPSVLFALQNQPLPELQMGDLALKMMDVELGIAKFDLSLYVAERSGGLDLWLEFDTGLYGEPGMARFVTGFERLVRAMCEAAPRPAIRAEALLGHGASCVVGSATDSAPGVSPQRLAQTLLQRAAQAPHAPALWAGGRSFSYAEMLQGIGRVQRELQSLGAVQGQRLVLLAERNYTSLCVLWACLLGGIGYVPLSREMPPAKLRMVIEEAQAHWLVADGEIDGELSAHGELPWQKASAWLQDLLDGRGQDADAAAALRAPDVPGELPAYLIFTSGSTGRPKGVLVTQHNLAAFAAAMDERLEHEPGGAWLAVSSLSFDIAVLELLWAMSRGLQVVIRQLSELCAASADDLPVRQVAAPELPALSLYYFGSTEQYPSAQHLQLIQDSARWADQRGLASLWMPERHFSAFGGFFSNPVVLATHLAALTQRIGLRAGSVIAPLHHGARLAEDWAMLDRLSGGRAGLSLAAGWNPADFVLATQPMRERRDQLEQQVHELRALWRGELQPYADASGRYFDVSLSLPPRQDLPLSLTVSNRPEQFRLAAEMGLDVLTHLLEQDLEQLAGNVALYRQAWQARWGDTPRQGRVVLMMHTFIGEDDEQAERAAQAHLERYLAGAREALRSLSPPARGQALEGEGEAGLIAQAARRLSRERCLISGPGAARKRLGRLYRLGVDEVACLVDFGPGRDTVMPSLERLAAVLEAAGETPARQGLMPPISHLQCTPSAARLLLQQPALEGLLEHLQCWAVGGEALDSGLLQRMRAASQATLLNLYGPTEATVWASCATMAPRRCGPLSIGQALPGVRMYVLDGRLEPVMPGVAGQLFIAGLGLAQAYWRHPGLTARSFVPDPFQGPGARMYASGDLVRMSPSGRLEFLGRLDRQVKIAGLRIELEGVQQILAAHAEVQEAVVLMLSSDDEPGPNMVAFVVARPACAEGLVPRLRQHLIDYFEPGSLPRDMVLVPGIPLSVNQKTDTAQLAEWYRHHLAAQVRDGAGNGPPGEELPQLHRDLRDVWRKFLPRVEEGVDFHRLGGNSLMALQLLAHANSQFGVDVGLQDFYRDPTLGGHLRALGAARRQAPRCKLLKVARSAGPYPTSFAQRAMLILDALGQATGDRYHDHIVLRLTGRLSAPDLRRAYETSLARHHIFSTGYRFLDGDYVQCWDTGHEPVWREVALGLGEPTEDLFRSFIDAPFELTHGDVIRGMLVRQGAEQHMLCIVMHHIVSDGATVRLLLQELLHQYQLAVSGQAMDVSEAAWQYVDYADWQRRDLQSRQAELQAFSDADYAKLPVRHAASHGDRPAGHLSWRVDARVTGELEGMAQREGCGLFAALVLPLCLLLEDGAAFGPGLTLATDARNRPLPEFERIPGMMVNQLLLRLHLPSQGPLAAALRVCHGQITAAFSHQEYPYEWLVSRLRHDRTVSLFDVKLVLNEQPPATQVLAQPVIEEMRLPPRQAKFGILINVQRDTSGLLFDLVFDQSRHAAEDMQLLSQAFAALQALLPALGDVAVARKAAETVRAELASTHLRQRAEAALQIIRNTGRRTLADIADA